MGVTAESTEVSRRFEGVLEILRHHASDKARLVPILQEVQALYRYLPEEVMTFVATALEVSPAQVYGVATFYSHFTLVPKGKYVIRVCDGTACHVKGSSTLVETLRTALDLPPGKDTTPDLLFTLETVSCLGACGLAPAVVINEEVHGQMTPGSTTALIRRIQEEEAQ